MKRFRTVLYLVIGVLFVAQALLLQDDMYDLGMRYYLNLSEALQLGGEGASPESIPNCELETLLSELAATPDRGAVNVGPCDVVLISGLVAAGGFLCYLLIYCAAVGIAWMVLQLFPPSWRRPPLILLSIAFLGLALPVRPALWFLQFGAVACLLATLPLPRRWRAVALPAATVAFFLVAGQAIVALCANEFFHIHRIYWGPGGEASVSPVLRDLFQVANLGTLGVVRMEGEGFPYLLPALGLLITLPRRIAWLTYELWVGRTDRVDVQDCFLYLLGLPFLIGNAATPSYQEFSESFGRGPDLEAGGRTLAWCLGFGTLGYTALLALGYSPAVRLLFPRCDMDLVSSLWVWGRLVVMYLITYLYLLSTEQLSVGVCRIYGYGVPDNYDRPLQARNVADFWRRWNILWRNFLVTVFFLPTALGLGRRFRRSEKWHLVVATAVTFLGTYVLNALPLVLLSGFGRRAVTMSEAARPGPGLTETVHLDPSTQLTALLPAMALYYTLEGAAVAWNLYHEAAGTGRRIRLPQGLAVAITFLFVAAARVFVDPGLALAEKLDLLRRALGF